MPASYVSKAVGQLFCHFLMIVSEPWHKKMSWLRASLALRPLVTAMVSLIFYCFFWVKVPDLWIYLFYNLTYQWPSECEFRIFTYTGCISWINDSMGSEVKLPAPGPCQNKYAMTAHLLFSFQVPFKNAISQTKAWHCFNVGFCIDSCTPLIYIWSVVVDHSSPSENLSIAMERLFCCKK